MSQTTIDRPPRGSTVAAPGSGQRSGAGLDWRRPLGLLRSSIPTLLVFGAFGTLFYYGHQLHWKLPEFSQLTGAQAPVREAWCEEHGVPEAECVACNPDLYPKGEDYGWCSEHGVHNCPLHHPEVAQLKQTPAVSQADLDQAAEALSLKERPQNNAACKVYQRRIQFASVEAVQQAGVDVELVDRRPIGEAVSGNGEITYDATRFASLSSRASGTTWRVLKNIGDAVREGDVLAVVDAAEVGRTKTALVKALVAEELARENLQRLRGLSGGVVAGRRVLEAEAEFAQAEAEVLSAEQALANLGLQVDAKTLRGLPRQEVVDRLRFAGLPAELARRFAAETATANLVPVRSPLDGVVVHREVVAGEVVDPKRTLFQVADTSRMWLMLNVPLEEAGLLSPGQTVHFRPDGSAGEATGRVAWISTAADKETRMVKVRADLENPDGKLRDETFGTGRVVLRPASDVVAVPKQAIHWEGCCQVVFVRDKHYFDGPESPKLFHVRSVRTGASDGASTEIIAGLLPGEVVVTKGSDVLRAQLLKNSLGEGCCAE